MLWLLTRNIERERESERFLYSWISKRIGVQSGGQAVLWCKPMYEFTRGSVHVAGSRGPLHDVFVLHLVEPM